MEFQVTSLALFLLFSVVNGFWMGILYNNIELMPEFLKGTFFPTIH